MNKQPTNRQQIKRKSLLKFIYVVDEIERKKEAERKRKKRFELTAPYFLKWVW